MGCQCSQVLTAQLSLEIEHWDRVQLVERYSLHVV